MLSGKGISKFFYANIYALLNRILTAQGDIIVRGAALPERLAKATNDHQCLAMTSGDLAWKYGIRQTPSRFGPADIIPLGDTQTWTVFGATQAGHGAYYLHTNAINADSYYYIPVHLPVGATVSAMIGIAEASGGAGALLEIDLVRAQFDADVLVEMANLAWTNEGKSSKNDVSINNALIDNTHHYYFSILMHAKVASANTKFYNVRLNWS